MPFVHKETGVEILGVETGGEFRAAPAPIKRSDLSPGWVRGFMGRRDWPSVRDHTTGLHLMALKGGGTCWENEMEWRDEPGGA